VKEEIAMVDVIDTTSEQAKAPRAYVVAAKLTATSRDAARSRADKVIHTARAVPGHRHYHEFGPTVVELSPSDASSLSAQYGDEVIVTPLKKYTVALAPTFPAHARQNAGLRPSDFPGPIQAISIHLTNSQGAAIMGARVVGLFSQRWRWGTEADSDVNGVAQLQVPATNTPSTFEVLYIYPPHSHWPAFRVGIPVADQQLVL
jgi:hypothetical protein